MMCVWRVVYGVAVAVLQYIGVVCIGTVLVVQAMSSSSSSSSSSGYTTTYYAQSTA